MIRRVGSAVAGRWSIPPPPVARLLLELGVKAAPEAATRSNHAHVDAVHTGGRIKGLVVQILLSARFGVPPSSRRCRRHARFGVAGAWAA